MVMNQGQLCTQETFDNTGDIFGCHSWGGDATSIQWVEARAAAEHPTRPRTALYNRQLAGPKCQQHPVGKLLPKPFSANIASSF